MSYHTHHSGSSSGDTHDQPGKIQHQKIDVGGIGNLPEGTMIYEYEICPSNPSTLEDFRVLDSKKFCGHKSAHTVMLRLPFCEYRLPVNDQENN